MIFLQTIDEEADFCLMYLQEIITIIILIV